MRFLTSFVAVVSTALAVSALELKHNGGQTDIIPGAYIVQLKEGSSLRRDEDVHARFESHLKRADVPFEIKTRYDVGQIFRGAAIQLASDDDAAKVLAMDSVLAVFPDKRVPRPEVGEVNAIGEVPAANPTDTYTPHQMTGVDKLHNQGILGKGVKVAVIDTGIDYTHPALGNGCFGAGCKVAKGYDFVGDNYGANDQYNPVPDNDPMDCGGHGSHVAGIIGADKNPLNFTGVAPEATLYGYRVFGCTGSTSSSIIIDAMLRAYQDGADVISISIGGGVAWTPDAESVVASRLVDAGVILSVSQGNSGDAGLWYTSAPAIGLGVLAVSSVDNLVTPAKAAVLSNGNGPYFLKGSDEITIEGEKSIFVSSADTSVANDGCNPYPAGAATGKVALVRRGSCSFAIKAQNALDAGAVVILFYNNVDGATTGADIGTVNIPQAMLTQSDGRAIAAAVAADPTVTISFPNFYYNSPNPETGGLVSDFTSYGLTADNYVKPQIGAPGGNILSTYPVAKKSYAVLSGTSMAAPHISGVAALFIAQNGKIDAHRLQNILQANSKPISTTVGGSQLNTVAQQGAGLIDAFNAVVGFKAILSPSEFSLNDTEHLLAASTFQISNIGSKATSYRISNLPAAAALTFGDSKNTIARPVPLVAGDATVTFDQTFVTVDAGAVATVAVTFVPPTGLDAKSVPVYSGFIVVESADQSERYSIPYAGTAASMRTDYPLLDRSSDLIGATLPALVSAGGAFVEGPKTFTFAQGDTLEIIYNLLGSSASILIDLVPSSYNLPAAPVKRHLAQKARLGGHSPARGLLPRAVDPALTVVGNLYTERYGYRNDNGAAETPYTFFSITNGAPGFFFSDGTKVPNGDYKVLLRALKFYSVDEYESWLSPVITVNQS